MLTTSLATSPQHLAANKPVRTSAVIRWRCLVSHYRNEGSFGGMLRTVKKLSQPQKKSIMCVHLLYLISTSSVLQSSESIKIPYFPCLCDAPSSAPLPFILYFFTLSVMHPLFNTQTTPNCNTLCLQWKNHRSCDSEGLFHCSPPGPKKGPFTHQDAAGFFCLGDYIKPVKPKKVPKGVLHPAMCCCTKRNLSPPLLSAQPPPTGHAQIKAHPRTQPEGPNKRPLGVDKAHQSGLSVRLSAQPRGSEWMVHLWLRVGAYLGGVCPGGPSVTR